MGVRCAGFADKTEQRQGLLIFAFWFLPFALTSLFLARFLLKNLRPSIFQGVIMIGRVDEEIGFMRNALNLHAQRQQLLAGNIANADTPNYKAVDVDFSKALQSAMGPAKPVGLAVSAPGHLQGKSGNPLGAPTLYRQAVQPSIDGNTVDMDVERAQFVDNAIRYQFALDRVSGVFKDIQLALRGQ